MLQEQEELFQMLGFPNNLQSNSQSSDLDFWLQADVTKPSFETTTTKPTLNEEEKRRRNTFASAKFRAKKKLKEAQQQEYTNQLQQKVLELEEKVKDQEKEIKWLKSLLQVPQPDQLKQLVNLLATTTTSL